MKKTFDFPNESIKIIENTMEEKGYRTEISAIIHILDNYKQEEIVRETMEEKLEKMNQRLAQMEKSLTRLRLGLRNAEQNSIMILDLMNTFMYQVFPEESYLMPAYGDAMHDLTAASKNRIAMMIANAKQKKDHEKSKKGTE